MTVYCIPENGQKSTAVYPSFAAPSRLEERGNARLRAQGQRCEMETNRASRSQQREADGVPKGQHDNKPKLGTASQLRATVSSPCSGAQTNHGNERGPAAGGLAAGAAGVWAGTVGFAGLRLEAGG
ncbi:hypothetical protein KC354_g11472 [Hortaea werneckii]|nr:hypothetical protein KC354_g11472 [Hortaea werneckii]